MHPPTAVHREATASSSGSTVNSESVTLIAAAKDADRLPVASIASRRHGRLADAINRAVAARATGT
jgi:hypothetical protein